MNFGFDLEGTLDAEPEMFRELCESLIHNRHKVYVITAYYSPDGLPDFGQEAIRRKQLADIAFNPNQHFTEMFYAPGSTVEQQGERKTNLCRALDIRLMFEDRPDFTDQISDVSRCVLIQPRR